MLNLFKYCFDCRVQLHLQHLSITENCVLCFHCYHLLDCCVQDMYENSVFQILSHYKYFVSSLNLHKLLMKQVFKVLYYLTEIFLSSVIFYCVHESYHIHTEQHVFSAILTFAAHSFSYCCHNLLL